MATTLYDRISDTLRAGWELPLRAEGRWDSTWDVVEADGTRIAICGTAEDANLILAALTFVLEDFRRHDDNGDGGVCTHCGELHPPVTVVPSCRRCHRATNPDDVHVLCDKCRQAAEPR